MTTFECLKCGTVYPERVEFCHGCGSFDSLLMQSSRPADQLWRQGGECLTASEMLKKSFASVHSTGYPSLRIGRQALVALYGPPGGGKSTFLFKFLDGVEGEVLYLSLEEGLSDTVVDRLRRLEVCRGDFRIGYARTVDEIADLVNKHRPNAIGLDSLSITTLTVDDLMRLSSCVGVPVLFSLHTTKDGLPAGSMTTLHAADVVLRVGGMRWAVEKSRFTGPLEGEV